MLAVAKERLWHAESGVAGGEECDPELPILKSPCEFRAVAAGGVEGVSADDGRDDAEVFDQQAAGVVCRALPDAAPGAKALDMAVAVPERLVGEQRLQELLNESGPTRFRTIFQAAGGQRRCRSAWRAGE